MGSANIQAKIRRGLAKAINKTGSDTINKVFLVRETRTGGTPLDAPTITSVDIELVDAIFRS